nr:phage minor tail protein L [uncultured Mediterranean phage uvMED]
MSIDTAPVFDEIQKINPSAIIELFKLELKEGLNYQTGNPTGVSTIYRFHGGSNLDANGEIVWNSESYLRFPVEATGFAYQKGQLPRPTLTISNMGSPSISSVLLLANAFTVGNDLTGAKVTRIRTMVKFIDAANFSGATNPFGTPDPDAEFPREIYYIDRKSAENREVVQFELAAVFDLAGIRAPKRQCTRDLFPSIGTFIG